MSLAPFPTQNRFLAALPEDVRARLWPHFELVQLSSGKVLYESGDTLRFSIRAVHPASSEIDLAVRHPTGEIG